jgi:diguanylate cyclase (GGDEF)-like protein
LRDNANISFGISAMMLPLSNVISDRMYVVRSRWEHYVADGTFELFIEFTVAVNSLTEYFNRMRLPGLVRICEGLENTALAALGTPTTHPIAAADIATLQHQVDALIDAVAASRAPVAERRSEDAASDAGDAEWIKPRSVWLIHATDMREMAQALSRQLIFFGFQTRQLSWQGGRPAGDAPLAVLFIPSPKKAIESEHARIAEIRAHCAASQLIYLGAHPAIDTIVALMRSGIDVTIPQEDGSSRVLNCILDLVQAYEPEKYRVLVVEDSRVAVTLIQRTLSGNGIDSHAIRDPGTLLHELESYRPDLILMDMYMPRFNGVEATRVLRQMSAYVSLPIVYLSGEQDVGMQVEALRLGGDQFLIKPFNPVLLAAIVKTKIERFRETQRSTQLDGLTGLLNHTAAKSQLKAMAEALTVNGSLTVVMIDIDRFKTINDTYGHPVGDQVIRGLAWLLKGRLRSSDMIGRYGGEEFLIALPDVSPEKASLVVDRIRKDFSNLPHAHAGGSLFATFSAGIASYPLYTTAQELTEAADNALLEAKRMGRNRVERATSERNCI